MAKKLFGTDGVRGVAGEFLSAELATALGRMATLESSAARPQVLIVRDTRASGPMLEAALAEGITGAGGDVLLAGVLPTPAASVLVRRLGLDLAIVISASHNPWRDNGIKFFAGNGRKLDDEQEAAIEAGVVAGAVAGTGSSVTGGPGRVRRLEGALDDYLRELTSSFRLDLAGIEVVLDCANGAAFEAAPMIFERLGATVAAIGADPDGRNINEACGSTHPQALAARVVQGSADLGFAFDGDADRVVAVDGGGRIRDGDELLALIARYLLAAGRLDGGVAVTVMSNYGIHDAMREAGIEVATTPVGDRSVAAELRRRGWNFGGEQSGHVIWTDFAPTGDGIAAALLTISALAGRSLAEAEPMTRLPQVLINVAVDDRDAVTDADELSSAVSEEQAGLEGRGRVLVRPSGTEPLVRVMVEAPEESEAQEIAQRLEAIVSKLGN